VLVGHLYRWGYAMADSVAKSKGSNRQGRDRELLPQTEEIRRRTIRLLGGVAVVGLVGSVLYAAQFSGMDFPAIIAISVMLATASAIAGAALGFLFGIPRGRRAGEVEIQTEPAPRKTPPSGQATPGREGEGRREVAIRPNTNLEDISDWLTKILVGVGLTQLGTIADGLRRLGSALAPALGDATSSAAFGLTLVISFTAIGFLVGYLWTRFYLGAAFQRAETEVEREVTDVRRELEEVKQMQDEVGRSVITLADLPGSVARNAQGDALQPLLAAISAPDKPTEQLLREAADEYERLRRDIPSTPQRTVQLSKVVTDCLIIAQERQLPASKIQELFRSGEGGRVVAQAWIRANPDPQFFDLALDGIEHPTSAFEQYQALLAAEALVPVLDKGKWESLRAALEDQMSGDEGKYIRQDSDRWAIAQRILRLLERENEADAEVRKAAPAKRD
jgi:hypothetical protein